ncbi:MAG TPA: ClpXP protease specificity-enhancing factor [Solimonas sp.]|nr:ClpXP protease specificity-enhancing factor [Solimonas sp.]
MSSKSRRPYLIRAIYEWATENGYTPHMLVAADYPGVVVPREFVQEGRITLNIAPAAIQSLDLAANPIWFSARFSGRGFDVQVPAGAVLAVFARENGEGIVFGEIEPPEPRSGENADAPQQPRPKPGKPQLRVVK